VETHPGRFKDWIAIPRKTFINLCTHLWWARAAAIRGANPHAGNAVDSGRRYRAHWKYKEGRRGTHTEEDEAFVWLKRLVEWQQEVKILASFLIRSSWISIQKKSIALLRREK